MSRKPPPAGPCRNCDHQIPHNMWGKCAEPGCDCRSADFPAADQPTKTERKARKVAAGKQPVKKAGEVLVFRNPHNERPVAVPDEIVSAADRVYEAYLLHRRGWSWERVAREKNWPTAAAVAAEVKRYLDEGRSVVGEHTRRELLALEVDRLDTLQDAVWDAAMEGKVQAVMAARTLVMDRVKVLGLDQTADEHADGATTVVVLAGNEEDYVASLKAVVGDDAVPPGQVSPPVDVGDGETPDDG